MTTKSAEEMAEEAANTAFAEPIDDYETILGYQVRDAISEAFLSGAAWQRERDAEICRDMSEMLYTEAEREQDSGNLDSSFWRAAESVKEAGEAIRAQGEK